MACPCACSDSSSLGGKNGNLAMLKSKYKGSPGKIALPVGNGCPESKAMEAGGAVTLVMSDFACEKVQGIRIIIGDTDEGIRSGFERVNENFHTYGTLASVVNNFNLNAPIAI